MPLVVLLLQEVELAIGSITISGGRSTVADFSVPYYETASGYLAHIPRELTKWTALTRPYQFRLLQKMDMGTRCRDIELNDTQHNGLICDTQHKCHAA
jgi:hypothetical protein